MGRGLVRRLLAGAGVPVIVPGNRLDSVNTTTFVFCIKFL